MPIDPKGDSKTAAAKPKVTSKDGLSPGASLVEEALAALKAQRASKNDDAAVTADEGHLQKIRSASVAPTTSSAAARRTPRRPFQRPVGILVGGHYEVLRARQLSEGGMSIFLGEFGSRLRIGVEEVQVGKPIAMSFVLPSGDTISLRGEVIYHDTESGQGLHIGVKFGAVPMAQRRMIRTYVNSKRAGETVGGQLEGAGDDQFASVGVTRRIA